MVFDNSGSVTSFSSLLSTFGGSASQSSEPSRPPMTIPLLRAAPPKPSTTAGQVSSSASTSVTSTAKQPSNGTKPANAPPKQGRPSPPVAGVKRKAESEISNVQERKDRPPQASSSSVVPKPKPAKPQFGPAKMKTEQVSKPAAKPTNGTARPTPTASTSTTTGTSMTSSKGTSYKDLLERSKQRATVAVVGLPQPALQVKKTFTKEKKGWQKEILEKREAKTTKTATSTDAKKPGTASSSAAGKVEFGPAKAKGAAAAAASVGKGKSAKGRPEPPAPKQPPPKPLFGPDLLKKRKEEENPPSAKRQKVPSSRDYGRERERIREPVYHKRYVYAEDYESDYDSADSSDMEAAGLDILDEEEFSEKIAVKEDLREQKREEQLAAIKAARKKMR